MFCITYHKSAYSDLVCRKICCKNPVVFTLPNNEAHLGYAYNMHAVPFELLYSIAYFFTKIKEPAHCGKLLLLSYLDFSFQSGEGFHFLFLCRFIIYVHAASSFSICPARAFLSIIVRHELCYQSEFPVGSSRSFSNKRVRGVPSFGLIIRNKVLSACIFSCQNAAKGGTPFRSGFNPFTYSH